MLLAARELVARQYEHWCYPAPLETLDVPQVTAPESKFQELRHGYRRFWPRGPYREDLRILVAGCGTYAAAAYAYLYPRSQVTGIDISAASLAHSDRLRQRHGLKNLTLRRQPIEELSAERQSYDFISCHGVLHHMADPVSGLRALGGVLGCDGVIDLMVYGRYGRAGVYMLQELFPLLGADQSPRGLETVRQVLRTLGPQHPVQRYVRLATDLDSPAGLVDTFLHACDRAYTAPECLDLVQQAGLVFQGWGDNGLYYPDARLAPDSPLRALLEQLDDRHLWQAVELLDGTLPGHWFTTCRSDRNPADYTLQFDGAPLLDYVPQLRAAVTAPADWPQRPARIERPPLPPVPLDSTIADVLQQVDGRRSVQQCLQIAGLDPAHEAVSAWTGSLFRTLWRMGHVLFAIP